MGRDILINQIPYHFESEPTDVYHLDTKYDNDDWKYDDLEVEVLG